MIRPPRPAGRDDRPRQREIEAVLAEHGLLRGPRRIDGPAGGEGLAGRLAAALPRLGPGFTAFGLYLGSRPDLLRADECAELSALPDRSEPLSGDEILALATAELGRPPQEVFAAFEEVPRASRLLFQEHGAALLNGEPVVVRFLRQDIEERIEADLPWLPVLAPVFAEAGLPGFPLAAAIADFHAALAQSADLAREAEALELLAGEAEGFGPLRAARVWSELSTARFLVFADLGGISLDAVLAAAGETVARRLCLVWLRQALLGRAFPVEPTGSHVAVLPGERIALTGGAFARPPAAAQANLWRYLIAAVERNPDEACKYLLREMTLEGPSAIAEEQLRLRLRQAVPFRDGSWSRSGDSLAEHLFLHWRFAVELGYRPRIHLVAFFRGLYAVGAAARRLSPGRDALVQGIEEARLVASVNQIGDRAAPERLEETLEQYAMLLSQLPQRLDEALTAAAAGGLRQAPPQGTAPPPERERASPLFAAGLLGLGAAALLARAFPDGVWGERIGAALVLIVGFLLLRLAGRR